MTTHRGNGYLRKRDGHEARVSYAELFFDLVYAFAVTQLSHTLLHHLTIGGAVETVILWFAVWLVWQYTCWFTNWFEPEAMPIRIALFVVMLLGLVMAAVLPEAFGERGLVFAGCYAAIQVGRTAYGLFFLKRSSDPLVANFQRLLGWSSIAAVFWLAGGFAEGESRILLWIVAVACEYFSPMFGLWLPGLGRSQTSDWTIEGGHLAERCALFVILALGESILVTGGTIAEAAQWDTPILAAFLTAFVGSIAMWWMYFDTSSRAATEFIVHSHDPGRFGAYTHYVHAILIAGVIVTAVGNDLSIAHPHAGVDIAGAAVLFGGPAIYIAGNALYKRIIYGRLPLSHIVGLALLAVATPFASLTDLLMASFLTTLIMALVAGWEAFSRRHFPVSARSGEPA
jgi:low temperature requirement protein LtrA